MADDEKAKDGGDELGKGGWEGDFVGREGRFNNSIGAILGGFTRAMVQADLESVTAYIDATKGLLDAPNVKATGSVSLIGRKQPLAIGMDVPRITFAPSTLLRTSSAKASMDMTVSSHQESTLNVGAKASGGGSVGWGPFSAHFEASTSVSNERKRSSDYSATTHAEIEMVQLQAPEGVLMIVDAMHDLVRTGLDCNKQLIQAQAQALQAQVKTDVDAGKLAPADERPKAA